MEPQIDNISHTPVNAISACFSDPVLAYSSDRAAPRYCGSLTNWQRRRVTQYIEENLSKIIRIEELAELARLSCGYFTTTFKADFGRSPYQYIIWRRLEMAKSLLQDSHRSLCDIAIDCGLSDQSHLCNLFRRHFGTTPAKWRIRAHSNGHSDSSCRPE